MRRRPSRLFAIVAIPSEFRTECRHEHREMRNGKQNKVTIYHWKKVPLAYRLQANSDMSLRLAWRLQATSGKPR